MKKHFLFIIVFLCSTIFLVANDDEQNPYPDPLAPTFDGSLFQHALENLPEYNPAQCAWENNNRSYPLYQQSTYDNGIFYQRIGRFSYEDYFDESCVDNIIASAPACIRKIIVNLLYPPKNKAALPKRLLLVGKPGTGKTTLAKAIAIKCDYEYYVIEAPFLLNEYKNSGPQNLLREIQPLLDEGKKVVVILDELTELTDKYKKENDSDSTVASALWILLDSCAQCENIFFIGTSNKARKDLPAQLKSRFDEDIVKIEMPHTAARKRILLHYLKDERHALSDAFLKYLIKKTDGRSAREIEKLVCKAIQFANLRIPRRYTITEKDFLKALGLWKPFWHPVVIYEKMEPHLQPFFKTAFPIILQTIGLIHSIYIGVQQQRNADESLQLQKKSLESQKIMHEENKKQQQEFHKKSMDQQEKFHDESHELQKNSAWWTKSSIIGQWVTYVVGVIIILCG